MLASALHFMHLAAAYGTGIYNNSGDYNGSVLVALGPVVLPNTGAGWATLIGALLVAAGAGVAVWARLSRRAGHRASAD